MNQMGLKSNNKDLIKIRWETHRKGEETRRPQSQRLEWCDHKPRNAWNHQSGNRQGINCPTKSLEGTNTFILNFWFPELLEITYLLFKATKFVKACYGSGLKRIGPFTLSYLIYKCEIVHNIL